MCPYDVDSCLDTIDPFVEHWEDGNVVSAKPCTCRCVVPSVLLENQVGADLGVHPLITFAQVPRPYTIGSLLRFSKEASYWAFSIVGNWAERFRMYAHEDVMIQQAKLEEPLFAAQVCLVGQVRRLHFCCSFEL